MIGLRTYSACHDVAVSNVGAFIAGSAFLGVVGLVAAVVMLIERRRQDRRFAEMRDFASAALGFAETATNQAEHAARMAHA